MTTPTRILADTLLPDGGLAKFIADRRPDRSWRMVARDLLETTNGRVDVTPETVRRWSAEIAAESSQAQAVAETRPGSEMAAAR